MLPVFFLSELEPPRSMETHAEPRCTIRTFESAAGWLGGAVRIA